MGQKDLTQKNLEYYPDIFADIINALLYEGRQVLQSNELQPASTETLYHSKTGHLRNQFHDVSKYVMHSDRIKLQYTIENEVNPNNRLILRKAGYEGAVYREQYDKKTKEIYPVISMVLYWGRDKRRIIDTLHSLFKQEFSEDIIHYIDDAKLYIFHMRCLPKEVRERFQSDMRIVVDYLAEGKNYIPTAQKLKHPEALLRMLKNLTGDERYLTILKEIQEDEQKGEVSMCELLDKYWNDGVATGIQKGIQTGMQKGIQQGKFLALASLVKQGLLQVVDAAKQLDISKEEFERRMNESA